MAYSLSVVRFLSGVEAKFDFCGWYKSKYGCDPIQHMDPAKTTTTYSTEYVCPASFLEQYPEFEKYIVAPPSPLSPRPPFA